MIGEAYFQLRAQIGTAFFSLARLATEAGVSENLLAALKLAQAGMREPFVFLAIGPSERGKAALFNALFEREFCGEAVEPATAGKIAVFRHGEEVNDSRLSAEAVECQRPHSFLRDFTLVDTAGFQQAEMAPPVLAFEPYLVAADTVFFVLDAGANPTEAWAFLSQFGREVLRRTIVVVWPADSVSAEESAMSLKRLRQAMLKNLGHACPIFAPTLHDAGGRDKLVRWLESEVIFSTMRRTRLHDLDRLAEEALREMAERPRAAEESWHWANDNLRRLRDELTEREEQSDRQIAGSLWTLAQSCDALRERGEGRLRARALLRDLLGGSGDWRAGWAREVEAQARASLHVQTADALDNLESDLRQAHDEHRQLCRELLGEELPGDPPPFPREELSEIVAHLETPLAAERALNSSIDAAARQFRLPFFAMLGVVVVALGFFAPVGALALGTIVFVGILWLLLREHIVAGFGHHFTANRATFLTAMESPLRDASRHFFAALAQPLEGRLSVHSAERHRHEPILARIGQLQETFARIAATLRASTAPARSSEETPALLE